MRRIPVLGRIASRLTYANVLATLALFAALGGASYAALAIPANSVGTRQLAFPLGFKTREGANKRASVDICPPGAHCPKFMPKRILSLRVSLKRSARLLVLGQTQAQESQRPTQGRTVLDLGVSIDRFPVRG